MLELDDINVLVGMSVIVLFDMLKFIEFNVKFWLVFFGVVVIDNVDLDKVIVWCFKFSDSDVMKGIVEVVEVMIMCGIFNGLLVEGLLNDDDKIVVVGVYFVKEG